MHEELEATLRTATLAAAERLHAKGWFGGAGCLMVRIPGKESALVVDVQSHAPVAEEVQRASLRSTSFPRSLLDLRPDVGGMALGRPAWGSLLAQSGADMLPIFDEQVRHLGTAVARLDEAGKTAETGLRTGLNGALIGDRVLCLGVTVERAVFNAELFEKCAHAFLLAHMTGQPLRTIPWLVRWIAGGRLRRDQRVASRAYAQGELPTGLKAY